MTTPDRLAEDVRFLRGLLRPPPPMPAAIALLWAALGAPGFALLDLAPAAVPWYWLIAAPGGTALSIWLGRRQGLRAGELDATGPRWMWHWLAVLAAIGLAVTAAMLGLLPFDSLDLLILVLLTVAYGLAGVHLDRRLLSVAAAFALALPLTVVLPRYGWTAAGGLVALALVGVALAGRERRGA